MTKGISHTLESAQRSLDEKHGGRIYELKGAWKSSNTKILTVHIACGYEWEPTYNALWAKVFCPACKLTGLSKRPLSLAERLSKREKLELQRKKLEDDYSGSSDEVDSGYIHGGFTPYRLNENTPLSIVPCFDDFNKLRKQIEKLSSVRFLSLGSTKSKRV